MTISARFRHRFGSFELDVDFTAPGRGVTALVGPSGCGKTTLLRAIAGLDHLDGGYLRVGDDIWQDQQTFVPVHQRAVGYVFQDANLFSHLSVRGNLEYGWKRTPAFRRTVAFADAVKLLGLDELVERGVDGLSGGEKQRVALARTLLCGPRLLLLDEPLASLDAGSKHEILPFLASIPRELELPVLYVSHDADEVARLADHLACFEDGRIAAIGGVSEMLTRLDLPLSRGPDAEALIVADVVGYDPVDRISEVRFSGGILLVTGACPEMGSRVRLRIKARDVSLTLEPPTGSSILNVVPAIVREIASGSDARDLVRLDCDGTPLLALVSRRSVRGLGLGVDSRIHAQVKSVAVLS